MQLLRRFLVPIGVLLFLLIVGIFGLRACLNTSTGDGSTGSGGSTGGILSRIFPSAAGVATLTPAPAQAAAPPAQSAPAAPAPDQPQPQAPPATAAPPQPTAPPTVPVPQDITPVPPTNSEGTIITGNTGNSGSVGAGSGSNAGASSEAGGVTCGTRIIHTVRAGENLFRIGLRYNTTASAIARLNRITNVRNISVGRRLVVVACARGSSSGAYYSARSGTYVVRAGDTLFSIALRFGVNVQYLCRVNGLYTSLIVPGQALVIP